MANIHVGIGEMKSPKNSLISVYNSLFVHVINIFTAFPLGRRSLSNMDKYSNFGGRCTGNNYFV